MTERNRSTVDVETIDRDLAETASHRLQVGQHLGGEGLVHVEEIDVFQAESSLRERFLGRKRRRGQELPAWIDRGVAVRAQETEGLFAERFRLVLAHEQKRGG